jgi:sigma-B regulation protein RsbU (phosphoserine phosphatase)
LIFGACALYGNISGAIGRYTKVEPYGFAVFLGCLGYVAARQTLERDSKLGQLQKELQVARRIQLSILPVEFPASASFRVAARYVPMTSVAGDFYEFLLGNDKQAGLLIADVSGHGVPAALIASMVKMAATSQRALVAEPAQLLAGMNAALIGNTQQQFVTAAYVYLDAEAGELRYSAAGHPPMLLLRRSGEVLDIEENGLILAAFSSSLYTTAVRRLEAGDRLLLYTDGITEASNARREEFGLERLRELLQKGAALATAEAAELILFTVREWAASQEDDLTVLVCDYAGIGRAGI